MGDGRTGSVRSDERSVKITLVVRDGFRRRGVVLLASVDDQCDAHDGENNAEPGQECSNAKFELQSNADAMTPSFSVRSPSLS